MREVWEIIQLNPEPWAIGPLSVGRSSKGFYPKIGPNQQLVAFKEAVAEHFAGRKVEMFTGEVELQLYFWRRLDVYETPAGRKSSKKNADLTNLQKGIEDALQGILFKNDRSVKKVTSVEMEQSREVMPMVIVGVRDFIPEESDTIPDHVWIRLTNAPLLDLPSKDKEFITTPVEEIF